MTSSTTLDLITRTGEAASRLGKALAVGASVQWERSLAPTTQGEGRAQGTISDPTVATATDEKRLQVRSAVIDAELTLEQFIIEANSKAAVLESATAAWAGPRG